MATVVLFDYYNIRKLQHILPVPEIKGNAS